MIKEYVKIINNKVVKFKCNDSLESLTESFIQLIEE